MLTTTVLIAIQFKYVKSLPIWTGLLFFLVFGFFDGKFARFYPQTKLSPLPRVQGCFGELRFEKFLTVPGSLL